MRVLHINSYCAEGKFYKHLYDSQKKIETDFSVYIPVRKGFDISKINVKENAIVSETYAEFDRYLFARKLNRTIKDIKKNIDISNYDIMHAHSLFANGGVAYALYKQYKIPYIVAVRDTDINFFMKKFFFLRNFGKRILENASKIIFISPEYRENGLAPYIKDYKNSNVYNKSVVVPNGIDPYWTDNMYLKQYDDDEIIKILCVAVIQKRKNLIRLADACKIIVDSGKKLQLTIVGRDDDKSILKKLLLYDFVKYVPFCPKESLINYYHNNDIFVLVSKTETFGLVYLEALSQGLPVVYTAGQGFDGQFPEGYIGYRANCQNINDIADKIIQTYKQRHKLSENGNMCLGDFSWLKIAKNYDLIYKECIHTKVN